MIISNQLASIRKNRGLSAAELARRVEVTRQTIYAIEDGSFVPNTAVALKLAHVLELRVEDLFAIELPADASAVDIEGTEPTHPDSAFARIGVVNGKTFAYSVSPLSAFLPRADAILTGNAQVQLLREPRRNSIVIAGCDPALSLLAEALQRNSVEAILVSANSRDAVQMLRDGRAHAAGSHLYDAETGDYNVRLVATSLAAGASSPKERPEILTFAIWQEGLLTAANNPKGIQSVTDLARPDVRFLNREPGAGSRDLLDRLLSAAFIPTSQVNGYGDTAAGHLAAAYAVAAGACDCCIANAAAARCFKLRFIPLATERFDIVLPPSAPETIKIIGDALNSGRFKRDLANAAGYDASRTGSPAL